MRLLILTILITSSVRDTYSQFGYYPVKPIEISDEEYRRGRLMLENTFQQVENTKRESYAYYWNIATAYVVMGQPKDTVFNFLLKSKEVDKSMFCQIASLNSKRLRGIENTSFYKKLGDQYKKLIESCSSEQAKPEKQVDILTYSKEGGFNFDLVKELDRISKLDQKYRFDQYDPVLQTPLDQQNMKDIEKVISKYGYPGKSLVGKQYDYIACSIIQRSNSMEYWDKYLPLVSDAVKSGELSDVNHLKMLLDRVYIDKIGAQIFGSKVGVNFADDETILSVKRKYRIDGEIDIESYASEGGYNKKLIIELDRITRLDQKFRSSDNQGQQVLLDRQNIKDIQVVIKKYGYPGRKLVGKKYESVAWAVIQHAELPQQEKYLPLIHKAVVEQQLEETPFKMLIDRVYWKKTGFQVFGSQAGIDFADDKTIAEVKAKYAIK